MSFRETRRFGIKRRGADHDQEGGVTNQVFEEAMHCSLTIHCFTEKNLGGIDFSPPRPAQITLYCRLRRQLADQRRPVGERRAYARPMAGAPARTEQIVSGSAHEEGAAPVV